MSLFRVLTVVFTMLASSSLAAAVLFEPYLGFRVYSDGSQDATNGKNEYSYKGPVFGSRLGVQHLGLMAGLDFSLSTFDKDIKTPSARFKQDTTATALGAFVGLNLPMLLRAWGTYYFSQTHKVNAGAAKGDKFKGNGFGLGLGYTAFPLVSLNLEVRRMNFNKYEDFTSGTTSTISNKIDVTELLFSVSIPLTF
jgi:hypothetical protein